MHYIIFGSFSTAGTVKPDFELVISLVFSSTFESLVSEVPMSVTEWTTY